VQLLSKSRLSLSNFKADQRSFLWVILLFILSLLVRLIYALQIEFPPLDDPAYYIQAARGLGGPRPLDFEVGIIWNFQPLFETVRHPGMEFWMPLSSFAIALSNWLFGNSFFSAQLPGILAGSLLPLYTYWFGRRFLSFGLSLLAGLLVAFNPLLVYQSTLPDSSMLYAALIGAALLLWPPSSPKPQFTKAFTFGLLVGLAYLARTPAIFLAFTWVLVTVWEQGRHLTFRLRNKNPLANPQSIDHSHNLKSWPTLLGIILPIASWSLRNWLLFGFVTSPAGTQTIFLLDYQDLFNYRAPLTLQSWLAAGPSQIISVRLEALVSAWRNVLDPLSPPTALLAGLGLGWLAKRESTVRPAALYTLLLFLGVPLIFGVASLNGSYYHSAASSAPFLTVGLVYLVKNLGLSSKSRVRATGQTSEPASKLKPDQSPMPQASTHHLQPFFTQPSTLILVGLVLLNLVLLPLNAGPAIEVHRQDKALFGRVKLWLDNHPTQVVITNQPATLNYVTAGRVGAVRLPTNQDLTILEEVARKYGANYIILTEQAGRYPALLDASTNIRFPMVHQGGDFEVFAVPAT